MSRQEQPTGRPSAPPVRAVTALSAGILARDHILSRARRHPIVCISKHRDSHAPLIDPERLRASLGPSGEVWVIDDARAGWALTEALPERYDVFGDAVRIWLPGAGGPGDTPERHPRYLLKTPELARTVEDEIVARVRDGREPPERPRRAPREQERERPGAGARDRPRAPRERDRDADATPRRPRATVRVGDRIEGTIVRLSRAGADVEIGSGDVFVPMRELAPGFVRDVADAVRIGQRVIGDVVEGRDGEPVLRLAGGTRDVAADVRARGTGAILRARTRRPGAHGTSVELAPGLQARLRLPTGARPPREDTLMLVELIGLDDELEVAAAPPDAAAGEPVRLFDDGPGFLAEADVRAARPPASDRIRELEHELAEARAEIARLQALLPADAAPEA